MSEWFYAQNGQQNGPVSEEELQALADAGHLQPDDLIWKDGMPNWVPAGHTEGLFVARQAATQYVSPPGAYADQLPPARGAAYPSSTYADDWDEQPRRRSPGAQQGSSTGVWFGVIGGVLALVLIGGAVIYFTNKKSADINRRSFTLKPGKTKSFRVRFKKGDIVEINANMTDWKFLSVKVYDRGGRIIAGEESPTKRCLVVFVPEQTQSYSIQVQNLAAVVPELLEVSKSGVLTWRIHSEAKFAQRDQKDKSDFLSKREFSLDTGQTSSHYVRFQSGKPIEVTVRSNGKADVDLFVFDGSARQIARDVDASQHCRLVITPSRTETYKLQVVNRRILNFQELNDFNTGTLRWRALEPGQQIAKDNDGQENVAPFILDNKDRINPPPPPIVVNPLGVQNPPFTIRDVLPKTAPRLPTGQPYRLYTVNLQQGRTYIIEMTAAFDTYLYLKDSFGRNLMSDDDGGVGLNSKMFYQVNRTGLYRIYASSFSKNGNGAFTLTVR